MIDDCSVWDVFSLYYYEEELIERLVSILSFRVINNDAGKPTIKRMEKVYIFNFYSIPERVIVNYILT